MDVKQVHQKSVAQLQAAYQEAQLAYQQASLADDLNGAAAAAQQMAALEATYDKLNALAARQVPQSQPRAAKHGLSETELEIALNSFGPIKRNGHYVDMSEEQKIQLYRENRAKLHRMRASGEYRPTTDQTG